MKYKIIITNSEGQIIYEQVIEASRYSHAEKAAIAKSKELCGHHWHVKNAR